jgi:hypothetical protein
MLSGQH